MSAFALTERQELAMAVMAAPQHEEVMLFGGSRSGKTLLIVRAIVMRALRAPGSRHAIARFRRNACMASIGRDTLPKVMSICFPSISYDLNWSDGICLLPNGSEIWLVGLDDKQRTEKVLGTEFATIFLNEASQISWAARGILRTRLAQVATEKVKGRPDRPMRLRMFYDENPPDKGHWTYRYFVQKIDPESREPAANPETIGAFQINPRDNTANLPAGYLDTLKSLSARLQRRFLDGLFKDANPDALFTEETLDKWRVLDGELPDMQRIVIAVDPSGASDDEDEGAREHDAIGIVVAGLGTDGNGYLLEDLTVQGGPSVWGKVVATAFARLDGDLVVGETNYGGGMVGYVIKTARAPDERRIPFKQITASRGKAVRAEPLEPLVADGRIRLVGHFNDLEDELVAFTNHGYTGDRSPNRGDAFVFAFSELFSGIVKPKNKPGAHPDDEARGYARPSHGHADHALSWMGR